MDAQRFHQLEQFFARAVAASADERGRILAEAVAVDAEVGSELARLLAVDPASVVLGDLVANAGASLVGAGDRQERAPRPSAAELPDISRPSTSPAGELIGRLAARVRNESRYSIEGEIGRGGMGVILRAFDPDLRRVLAMKVAIQQGASSADTRQRERIGRFLEEAQITGQLDHPGIVPVHELGLDAQGRLYFTMRLVCGRDLGAIYELARTGEEGWSTTRLLGVLLKVCEAVAYAHSKGVVHRDLKPSNVMVGRYGEVYVMDWGLAKVLGRGDTHDLRVRVSSSASVPALQSTRSDEILADPSTPLVTMDGTVLGTPAYMSPEQAAGEVDAMDVRADVYALGAMLYHVFAGHPPYQENGETLGAHRLWQKIARMPPRPLAALAPSTPPELVAIVERAMARAMAKRYPSMTALAEDLRAYVEGRVVGAYETGSLAELRKWIGRNKALSASLAAAALAVAIGTVAFAIKANQATKAATVASIARADAEANAAVAKRNEEAAKQREAEAKASERRAERVTELVQNALVGADPNQGGAQKHLVTDAMDKAIAEIDRGTLNDDPETEASLQTTIARILDGNSRSADALSLAERALATRQRLFRGDHSAVAASLNIVACCLTSLGRFDDALAKNEAALAMRERLFPGDHHAVADSISNIGGCLRGLGRRREALTKFEAALEMYRRLFADGDHVDVATCLNNVATCLQTLGRSDEALPKLEAALEMRRRLLGDDHPSVAVSLNNVAVCLHSLGRDDEALPKFVAALDKRQRLFQGDHPAVALNLDNIAVCLRSLGRGAEALPKHEAALAMFQRLFKGDNHHVAASLGNVAMCLRALRRSSEALPRCEAQLEMLQRLFPGDHAEVAVSLNNLALCLRSLGRNAEARPYAERAEDMAARAFTAEHPRRKIINDTLRKIRASLGEGR